MSGLQLYRDEMAQPGIDSNDSNRYSETAPPKKGQKKKPCVCLKLLLFPDSQSSTIKTAARNHDRELCLAAVSLKTLWWI